jgi:hypothetical protein
MKRLLTGILLTASFGGSVVVAQNSDFGILYAFSPHKSTILTGSEISYAHELVEWPAGRLYLEVPVVFTANPLAASTIFFTPGVRFNFTNQSRVAPYLSAGGGFAFFGQAFPSERTASGAAQFGAGLDFRLTRPLSLRVQVRDLVTRKSLGDVAGRNHPVIEFGIAFHF